jgi:site-specific recombinase XerD
MTENNEKEQTVTKSKGKIKDRVNGKTTILAAFNVMQEYRTWAKNTIPTYYGSIKNIDSFMVENEVEPILENVDFELCSAWVNHLTKKKEQKATIKLRIATLSTLFSFLRDLAIIGSNPFLAISIKVDDAEHHSRALNFAEMYEVYARIKTDPKLELINLSVLVDLFTGFRNVNLCKLTVDSISKQDKGIHYGYFDGETTDTEEKKEVSGEGEENVNNSKNKKFLIPLPPRLFDHVIHTIKVMNLKEEDALLYGQKGLALANKQFNSSVNLLCRVLGWEGEKKITPHAFRYTLATIFNDLGVSDDAIRYTLGHSFSEKGNLRLYLLSNHKHLKEVRSAQIIIEEVFETFLLLEKNHMMNLNVNQIFQELQDVFQQQLKNEQSIMRYTQYLLDLANRNKQAELYQLSGQMTSFQQPQNLYTNPNGNGFYPNSGGMDYQSWQNGGIKQPTPSMMMNPNPMWVPYQAGYQQPIYNPYQPLQGNPTMQQPAGFNQSMMQQQPIGFNQPIMQQPQPIGFNQPMMPQPTKPS